MLGHRHEHVCQERCGRQHRIARRGHEMHVAFAKVLAEVGHELNALRGGEVIIRPQIKQRRIYNFSPLHREQMIMRQSLNASLALEHQGARRRICQLV